MPAQVAIESPAVEAGQFETGQVVTISAGHAVHDTYAAFLSPLLPVFIENLALSRTQAGLLAVFQQGPSLIQPLIGHLADRASLRWAVILTPAVTATAMSLMGVASTYVVLALLLTAAGLSSATLHAIAPVMAGRFSGRSLGRGMGIWMLGGELGRTLGPMLIVTAVELLGLKGTPWLLIGGFLTSALLAIQLRSVSTRPPGAGNGLPWRQALRVMGPFLVPLVAIILVRSFMISALTTYLPIFLTDEGANLWFAGASLSLLEAAGVAGALLGGSLSDRLGRRTVLFLSLATTPFLMFLFLLVDGWIRFPLLLALGFSALSLTPVLMAMVQERFPQNRALANGVYMAFSFLIQSGAIVVTGAIGDTWGMRPAFWAGAAVPLLGLPFLLLPASRSVDSTRG